MCTQQKAESSPNGVQGCWCVILNKTTKIIIGLLLELIVKLTMSQTPAIWCKAAHTAPSNLDLQGIVRKHNFFSLMTDQKQANKAWIELSMPDALIKQFENWGSKTSWMTELTIQNHNKEPFAFANDDLDEDLVEDNAPAWLTNNPAKIPEMDMLTQQWMW